MKSTIGSPGTDQNPTKSPPPSLWRSRNLSNRKEIETFFRAFQAAPRKLWGQNFLVDSRAQQRIVDLAEIQPEEPVWEIGPGLGALTQHIWGRGRHLTLFEIDPVLCNFYRQHLQGYSHWELVEGDILKTWKPYRKRTESPSLVIGNLPYNSASIILRDFAQADFRPRLVITIQREMAQRLLAKPRTKEYSSFTLLIQGQFEIQGAFPLPASCFFPQPRVESQVLCLKPRDHGLSREEIRTMQQLGAQVFSQRRKTIANNLKNSPFSEVQQIFTSENIPLSARAEELSLEQYFRLAQQICAARAQKPPETR